MCRYVKYTNTTSQLMFVAQEHSIYGSSRVGVDNRKDTLYMSAAYTPTWGGVGTSRRDLGSKSFELANHLGNVLVTISDKPIYKVSSGTIYFQPEITSISDYYPFGAPINGRGYSTEAYRFGYNSQEKTDEIAGPGNHNTATFWEYDSRLGRRWNLDPVYNTDISRYTVNGNNLIYYLDPNGDFKTKFGANAYKFFHGGSVTQAQSGKHKGEWYVHKKVDGGNGAKGSGNTLDEVIVKEQGKWGWGKNNPANGIDKTADGVNRTVDYVKKNASNIWNSPMARTIIPDYYTLSGNFQTSSGIYLNEEVTLTIMLRGKDPGLYFNSTTGFGSVSSVGVDVGFSVGKGYYLGDARNLSSNMLGGWQGSGSVGVGLKAIAGGSINGVVDVGFDDNGNPTTVSSKVGISAGVGVSTPIFQVSIGPGKATNVLSLIKF